MSRKPCGVCNGTLKYGTPERDCFRCHGTGTVPDAWNEPEDPPIATIRAVAREKGYAIGTHGTQKRDYDIIAVPWTDEAVSAEELLDAICEAINAKRTGGPMSVKPCGRVATNLQLEGWFKLIDISITPRGQHQLIVKDTIEVSWKLNGKEPYEALAELREVYGKIKENSIKYDRAQVIISQWPRIVTEDQAPGTCLYVWQMNKPL